MRGVVSDELPMLLAHLFALASPYLLTGLIHCQRCGHRWQGYTTQKGRKRADGSQPRNFYYGCNGYITKGNSCCQRAVVPQALLEGWVMEQIGQLVQSYLADGGEKKLRQMIEQELAGEHSFDSSALANLHRRKTDIERIVDNLLDNITSTNRDYVDRRIEKLRAETAELERQEAALVEQQNREQQTAGIAQQAYGLMRDFARLAEMGTVDEKRILIRSFLQRIDFDPEAREGKAYFWVIPGLDRKDNAVQGQAGDGLALVERRTF